MCRECRERLPPPPRVSDPDKDHGTCVTHVPWCMPVSLTSGSFEVGGEENVPGIPGACASRNFTYLVRGPLRPMWLHYRGPQNADSVPAIIMIISRWTATRVTIITLNATLCTDGNIVITRSAAVVFTAITLNITLCIVRRHYYHLGHCPSLHCHYLEYHNVYSSAISLSPRAMPRSSLSLPWISHCVWFGNNIIQSTATVVTVITLNITLRTVRQHHHDPNCCHNCHGHYLEYHI